MVLDIFFADNSVQRTPFRPRMGRLVAAGGLYVPGDRLNGLERRINEICVAAGFRQGEEFKWSPRRDQWMHSNLQDENRERFYLDVVRACAEHQATATIVISDTNSRHPRNCQSHEHFVTLLLIERVEWLARQRGRDVIVVFDRPGGGQAEEDDFLEQCVETIQRGTPYVRPERIALNALSTSSVFVRLLQAADLIAGCTTAFVAGQHRYAPTVFAAIRPLLASSMGRVGGVGLKLHPDFWYANLYCWLGGDTHYIRRNVGVPLPWNARPFANSPDVF